MRSKYRFGSSQSFAECCAAQIGGYARYGLGLGALWFVAMLLLFGIGYGLLRRLLEVATHSAPTRTTRVAKAQPPSNLAIAGFALALVEVQRELIICPAISDGRGGTIHDI